MGVGRLQWSTSTCSIHRYGLVDSNMTKQVLCTNTLALRIVPCFCLHWCIMHYLVLPSITVNVKRPCAAFRTTSHHLLTPPTMLVPTIFFFFLIAFWIAAYIFETRVGAWAHAIVVEAAVEVIKEVVELAHQVAIKGIARCTPPLLFYFSLSADSPQGKRRTGCHCYWDPHRPQCHGIPPHGRRIRASHFDLW